MERFCCLKWFGVFLVLIGIVVVLTWENVLTHILHKEFSLSPTSQVFPIWKNPPLPIVLDLYLFNCTNTEELSRDFKPNLQEVGPFRFREYQNKVNITWNDNNTVTYQQQKMFYFDEEASFSSMDENITTLNMPPVTANYRARDLGSWASFSLSVSMKMLEKSIWVTKPIKEFLFEGYSDPLLTLSTIFSGGPDAKVGYFYGRNGSFTVDGVFNMETGTEDISRIGMLRQWNFSNRTHRHDEGCDDVRGYLGHFFPPKMSKDPFYIFSGEVCKSVECYFAEDVEIHGIKGYKFLTGKTLMDNGHTDPDTACNCGGDVCMAPGVLNLTRCLQGVPMFGSYPHFLNADPVYLECVNGLSPDLNRSDFHITIEPNLGIPMELAAHLQYNVLLQQNPKLSLFEDVPNILFPLFWVKKKVLMSEEVAARVKLILFLPTLGIICGVGLILLGLLMIFISLLPRYLRTYRSPITKIRTKNIEVRFSKPNEITSKKEEEDKEMELMKNEKDELSNEEKVRIILNCKETDILT